MTRPFPRPPDPPVNMDAVMATIDRMLAAGRRQVAGYVNQVETPSHGVTVRWTTGSKPALTVRAPEGARHALLSAYQEAHYRAEMGRSGPDLVLMIYP